MRSIVNCSEPCRASNVESFLKRFEPFGIKRTAVHTSYAMAEAVFAATFSGLEKEPEKISFPGPASAPQGQLLFSMNEQILSCGKPLPGVEVKIIGDDNKPLAKGELGEICLKGQALFSSYIAGERLIPPSLEGDFYRTGDLGMMHHGELYVLGRAKELIIINGRNFLCSDIEAMVSKVKGVKGGRVVALSLVNENTGSEECLVLVEKTDPLEDSELKREIRKALGENLNLACRVDIVPRGALVKTSSGKMSRSENLRGYQERLKVKK